MTEFEPIPENGPVADTSDDKPQSYGGGQSEDPSPEAPREPNSFYFPLLRSKHGGRRGSISWQSDNPILVLALIMLVLVLVTMILFGLGLLCRPESQGLLEAEKVLGQAMLILVGVIGGASSTRK